MTTPATPATPFVEQLALVAFPSWDEATRLRVETVREKHDPQARRIEAHFTLVFPIRMTAEPLIRHVESALKEHTRFSFASKHPVAVADGPTSKGHVLLVPDRGGLEIAALHARLYTGLLEPHLRSDLPFVPHITVAAHPHLEASRALADQLNRDGVRVQGSIDRLHLVRIDETGIHLLVPFDL